MTTVNGLPAHILLVHAIVVLLPLSALLLVLTACLAPVRRRLAGANAILSVLVVVLVPITTNAGEWLERRVARTPLVRAHTEIGDTAIWAAIPVAVLALALWWRQREAGAGGGAGAAGSGSAAASSGTADVAAVATGRGVSADAGSADSAAAGAAAADAPARADAAGSVATRAAHGGAGQTSGAGHTGAAGTSRRRTFLAPASKAVTVTLTVLSVLAAGAAVYDIVRIGDSGAQASWQGQFQQNPLPRVR
ncbi:hypothetical protein [Amycolatopsis orientalis]|uniref:hypothetical protein n=1 Tax=Amycolatopsis orientalis TaxID=31958 RepID=UPI0003A51055|nr:hypothetical protein [Amycolatopsis orientalis]